MSNSKRKSQSIRIASYLVIGSALFGCAPDQVENSQAASTSSTPAPSSSAPSTLATPAPSMSSEFEIPVDFPATIPILEGPVVLASATEEGNTKTWAVEIIVEDLDATREQTLSSMQQAGFALQDEVGIGTEDYNATFASSEFVIRCKIYLEADTGEREIRYVVTTL